MAGSTHKLEVLIADDEPVMRGIFQFYLELLRCNVQIARSGDEVIQLLSDCGDWIDLLILDAGMPGPSLRELFVAVRKANPHIAVLFCSGRDPDSFGLSLVDSRRVWFLPKPFNLSDLQRALEHALQAASRDGLLAFR